MEGRVKVAVPLDTIRAFHNAFRRDMTSMDSVALNAARGNGSLDLVLKRYVFFNEILVWHALGEEENVFPALEKVAPLVAEAYERDHRGLDSAYDSLDAAIKASDILATARATAAFQFHLGIHLNKEDAHLYRIFNERIPLPDQVATLSKMAQKIPQARFPEVVTWLFTLIGPDDRENVTRIWKQVLPVPTFTAVSGQIRTAIGNDWADLTRRIPDLV
jgi:hypothetical protein